jgi:hypothetical protein
LKLLDIIIFSEIFYADVIEAFQGRMGDVSPDLVNVGLYGQLSDILVVIFTPALLERIYG